MHQARHRLRALFAHTQMAQYQLVDDQALLDVFDAYCEGNREHGRGNTYVFPASLERWLQTYATRGAAIRCKTLAAWQVE